MGERNMLNVNRNGALARLTYLAFCEANNFGNISPNSNSIKVTIMV